MYYLESTGETVRSSGPFEVVFSKHTNSWCFKTLGGSLRARKTGGVDFNGGGGAWSQWRRNSLASTDAEVLRNVADPTKLLRWGREGLAAKTTLIDDDPSTHFRLALVSQITPPVSPASNTGWEDASIVPRDRSRSLSLSFASVSGSEQGRSRSRSFSLSGGSLGRSSSSESDVERRASWREDVALTPRDLEAFSRRGFVVVRGCASRWIAGEARRAVNAAVFARGNLRNVEKDPAVLDALLESDAWTLASRLVGRDKVKTTRPRTSVRVSPPSRDVERDVARAGRDAALGTTAWAVDASCALRVFVALSDFEGDTRGGLVVFPGSHETVHAATSRPRLRGGVELELDAGDAVLLHPELATAWAVNGAPDPGFGVVFRLERNTAGDGGLFGAFDALTALGQTGDFDELGADLEQFGSGDDHPFFM